MHSLAAQCMPHELAHKFVYIFLERVRLIRLYDHQVKLNFSLYLVSSQVKLPRKPRSVPFKGRWVWVFLILS